MSKSFWLAAARVRLKLGLAAAMAGVGALLIFVPGCFAQAAPGKTSAPYLNPAIPIQQRVDDLVSKMTLEEKVSQMQNHAAAIPRLGVAEYDWWSEALHGVARSGYATVFPQAIGMAATWDAPLIHEEAHIIGIEARGRYNSAVREDNHQIFYGMDFWSPNVNIFRDPRWGRGQETYGEDPFLTGQLGVQFVTGLQGDDRDTYLAISTPKHFDVHSGPESERHRFNVDVSAHDLEDTYLPAFRATIVDAHADSIMCAYNAIDGEPACANTMLLQKTLRQDWKFNGYVVSDCGAIGDIADGHKFAPSIEQASVVAVRAGTDLSCGDEYATLVKAVHDGLIKESEIDTAVKRLMTARIRMGILAPIADQPMQGLNRSVVFSPTHARLDLKAANESMVLLKNDGALPLGASVKTIAVIGPNAASIAALEGNYNGTPIDPETPLTAFKTLAAQKRFRILDVQGSPYVEQLSLPVPPNVFHTADGAEGLTESAFPNTNFSGPGITSKSDNIDSDWDGASPYPNRIPRKTFSVRWTGTLTPPAAGDITFQVKLADCYPCDTIESYSVWVDGKQVSSGTSPDKKKRYEPAEFHVHFADTKPHQFRLEYSHQSPPLSGGGITFNWQPPVDPLRQQAVEVAKQADAVVAFVGISPRLEGEEMPIHIPGFSGGDRTSIDLPDVQVKMLQAVAATGKPLIVVLMNGSALAVNWSAQHANAILEAWYPGARGGQAIVDTLLGTNNPAGRLPVTFYSSTGELPPFTDYSMADRTYRYFHGSTLYGFGFGLSYSQFKFDKLHVSTGKLQAGDPLTVNVNVTNTSKVDGDDVAELYLTYPKTKTSPIHALAGFSRVHVPAGATVPVQIKVDARQWSQVLQNGDRVILPGSYTLFVGGSQPAANAGGVSTTVQVAGKKLLPR
ncbi:MAG TPA: glycoside hydrolase family 3 C-terminal domain-containing protein [Acidobacteriaceae bacterium]|nr:glycoside hydrolase family 3 C-terminal domain-containing protein [Acidobacteriaceae bacterium]